MIAARLRRHPFPVEAFFDWSLVLAFAVPADRLRPLLPEGLDVDEEDGHGFLAIALVKTRDLRPAGLPRFLGRDFFLSGYRVFARYRSLSGRRLRGLRILRSDTDSRTMAFFGNLLTHYAYRVCRVEAERSDRSLRISIRTPAAEADLDVDADLSDGVPLPEGSPFRDWADARRFEGPLPFTFDEEKETRSIVLIEGVRSRWVPQPVAIRSVRSTFLEQERFAGARLANAFLVEGIPYRWKRGVVEKLPG